jgi:hypothetical protein
MDALLRLLVPHGRGSIAAFGTVTPLGASMGSDGEVRTVATPEGDAAPPSVVLESVYAELRSAADAGDLLATGVLSDVTFADADWPDGLRVELEHRDAEPITFVLPYRASEAGTVWSDAVTIPATRRTWDQPGRET